jgi:hypothetical protein
MAKNFEIKEKDKGWDKIKKELKRLDKSYTKIGIQAGESRKDGKDMVVIAATHEFGTNKAGKNKNIKIPERSFLRTGIDNNKKKINNFIFELIGEVEDGKINAKQAVGNLGEFGEGLIKRRITVLKSPPLKSETISKKGSSNPLIDTGQLKASIRHKDFVK